MAEPKSRGERFAKAYWTHEKQASQGLAEQVAPGAGGKPLTRAEEKLIFMARVDKDGKPGMSDEDAMQMLAAGKSREEVGLLMFPQRGQLVKSGGRIEPKDQILFCNKIGAEIEQQQAGMQPEPPMLGAPPPPPDQPAPPPEAPPSTGGASSMMGSL